MKARRTNERKVTRSKEITDPSKLSNPSPEILRFDFLKKRSDSSKEFNSWLLDPIKSEDDLHRVLRDCYGILSRTLRSKLINIIFKNHQRFQSL